MLMALGLYVFSISTLAHDELQRRRGWRFAGNARAGVGDSTQFVGAEVETVSLSGSVAAELVDGPAEIDTLVDMAKDGEAWPLVDGTGTVWGSYVITAIDVRARHLLADGTARRIDFALDLRAVPDVPAAA